jgi:DNA-directed RNA polymerase subunit L
VAKKKVESKEEKSDIDEKDSVDDEEIESHYPDVSKDSKNGSDAVSEDESEETDESEEEEGFEIEPGPEYPDYKYLKLDMEKGVSDNDYTLIVEGQSHGFCNIFVDHLLKTEGVNSAAYKITKIVPPEIFIRLEDGYKIKKILFEAIETLRTEVTEVQKTFKKLT